MAGGEGKRGSSGKAFVVAGMVVAAPLLTVVVVLLCLVILVVAILQSDYGLGTRCVTGSSSWVDWAVSIAKDDKHGYSQPNRGATRITTVRRSCGRRCAMRDSTWVRARSTLTAWIRC